jgi:hypothetical protein
MPTHDDTKLRGHVKGDKSRQDRLAAELRANLKKRKERARALDRLEHQPEPPGKTEN